MQWTQLGDRGPDPDVPEPQRPQAFPVVLQRALGVEEISAKSIPCGPRPFQRLSDKKRRVGSQAPSKWMMALRSLWAE